MNIGDGTHRLGHKLRDKFVTVVLTWANSIAKCENVVLFLVYYCHGTFSLSLSLARACACVRARLQLKTIFWRNKRNRHTQSLFMGNFCASRSDARQQINDAIFPLKIYIYFFRALFSTYLCNALHRSPKFTIVTLYSL